MNLSLRIRRLVCHLMALALLFSQAVSAAQACVEPAATPAMAIASDMADMDCEQRATPNVCLQQCTAGDQSSAQVQVAVAEMPRLAVLTVPVLPDRGVRSTEAIACLARSPDPPPSIRFCSFQL